MNVRPFDWRDIPALHRNRDDSVFLDSALVLTRGPLIVPGALFSYLAPGTGVFTCVADENDSAPVILGQFIHPAGSQFAHLTFITPETGLDLSSIAALLDYMVLLSGERGALRLLADVNERSGAFESLRKNGFAINARQRIWQMTGFTDREAASEFWRTATSQDVLAIRGLYNNLTPGLVQQVEPFTTQRPKGVVHYKAGDLLAYVELKYGHRGIWAQPFVHPDIEDVAGLLEDLFQKVPNRRSRPVYICVRSYQAWLEPLIEELGVEAGPRQAVMVKHLAQVQKVGRTFAIPSLESGQAKVSTPMAHSENK